MGTSCWSDLTDQSFYVDKQSLHGTSSANLAPTDKTEKIEEPAEIDAGEAEDLYKVVEAGDSDDTWQVESEHEACKTNSSLHATLRLMDEVKLRLLGEKTISEIETIEITSNVDDEEKEEEEKELNVTLALDKVEEEEAPENDLNEYLTTLEFSEKFVDGILHAAKQECKGKHEQQVAIVAFRAGYKPQNIIWPSVHDFNIKCGIKHIEKYIQSSFNLYEMWMYKITFVQAQSDMASDFYHYEAKFGLPTPCYPVAQTTVSLYFTYEVSRVVPEDLPVRVTFTIESLRRVMVPGEVEVNEEMLLRVLQSKLAVFKRMYF